ncbi:MAG TPA: hypothetical protein DDW95_08485 [Alphaproteobacteria bacterium]|nr:hypothetical protein [Alphaproteobacteria bacterium]
MIIPAATRQIPLLLLLSLCGLGTFTLSGCGNKGPLYLPPPRVEQQSLPLEEAPADDAQTSETE